MSFSYRDTIFDKRGCYVILPASPFWRIDSNDNSAEADERVEVLEGPEVEVDSCESNEVAGEEADMDTDTDSVKCHDESLKHSNKQNLHQAKGGFLQRRRTRTDPDNKYYEVEAILDGPKKRREHLFKVCYKVRWKGYGPEADTWQPITDLDNVQDMIDEFKEGKAFKKHEKEKKKLVKKSSKFRTNSRRKSQQWMHVSSIDSDYNAGGKQYDPIYGTVKDPFWKDLELGHHQKYSQLFSGDMYSKVKGSRRSGHAEVADVQEEHTTLTAARSSRLLRGAFSRKYRSTSPLALVNLTSSPRSGSPKLSPASRARKRANDHVDAKVSMSTKRSRRSREAKNETMSQDGKQSSISSVTSETVEIVTTSSSVIPQCVPNVSTVSLLPPSTTSSSDMSETKSVFTTFSRSRSPLAGESSDSEDSAEDVSEKDDQVGRMTVSSETMLTVTTESKRLVMEPRSIDGEADGNCLAQSSSVNVGASGSEAFTGSSFDASGATSGGSVPDHCEINKTHFLDAQLEASGAVERSHDEDCLWNGACNRSDCKSNRRRNMKNGKGDSGIIPADNEDQDIEGEVSETENENNNSTTGGDDNQSNQEESTDLHSDGDEQNEDEHVGSEYEDQNLGRKNASFKDQIDNSRSSDRTNTGTSHASLQVSASYAAKDDGGSSSSPQALSSESKRSANHPSSAKNSSSNAPAQMRRLLFSSPHADSSDSSFDDGPSSGTPLTREAVSNSFHRMDTLAHRLHLDTLAGSSTSKACSLSDLQAPSRSASRNVTDVRKNSVETERPGLFSADNSAFSFFRQDSGFSGQYSSTTPEDKLEQTVLSSSAGTINLCSPGKENFGNSNSKTSGLTASGGYSRLQTGSVDPDTGSSTGTSSQAQSLSSHQKKFSERSEGRAARKRASDIFQPLEKVHSPNSQDSELNQRIVTLTCDELEDLVEQGEEHYSQKDVAFITNADLLQAVNLSKAEVVKRAIKQCRSSERKQDFEQPDSTGLTLLMRAVQKGTVAIVEMLLEYGVDVNAQQTNGTTALMIAAEQNGTCLVALLLKYGANSSLYTVHSDQAETALMKAIKKQNREVVNLMLRVGVNIAPPTCTSLSALELAVERRNHHIEGVVRFHCQRLDQAFRSRVLETLEGTATLLEPLFSMQCLPLRESDHFVVKFNSNIQPVAPGEGFLLFIAHTKITEKGVRCRFHGSCPISSITLNGIAQSPLTKEVNFVTSCHPIINGCNTLVIHKLADYTSKAKLVVQAFRAKLLPC